jgi:dihydroorotase
MQAGALGQLEAFCSTRGPAFYGMQAGTAPHSAA